MSEISSITATSGRKQPLVFFGNERIATGVTTSCPVLRMLIEEGYHIAAVVVNESGTVSRRTRELEVESVAREHSIPILKPKRVMDIYDELAHIGAQTAILVAYGKIIPQQIIELFRTGIINIHPSALPRHRGSTPLESVLLDGEKETAVSLMRLAREMDAGPVYAQVPVALHGDETKQALADTLIDMGAETLRAVLPEILNGTCVAMPQDEAAATYDQMIEKKDGLVDVSKPAAQLEREVRAYAGWPGSHLSIAGKETVITRAHVSTTPVENPDNRTLFLFNKQLCLQAPDGVLIIDSLKPAGKTDMPATAFIAGHAKDL